MHFGYLVLKCYARLVPMNIWRNHVPSVLVFVGVVFRIRSDCHWRDRDFPWLSSLSRWIPEKYFIIDPLRMFQNPHQKIIHHLLLSHLTSGYTTLKQHNWLTWKSINQDSIYFWWGTSQTESPDHVPVHVLATNESSRRFTPHTWMDERNTQRIWRIVQILWEPDYSDRQAGELQCSVINRMAYVADRSREKEGCVPLTGKIHSQLQGPLGPLRREEALRAYATLHEYHTLLTLRHKPA